MCQILKENAQYIVYNLYIYVFVYTVFIYITYANFSLHSPQKYLALQILEKPILEDNAQNNAYYIYIYIRY